MRKLNFVMISAGVSLVAAANFFFLMPSHMPVGSITGLAIIISSIMGLPVSVITMALNLVLLLAGFLLIGREFGLKTTYGSILLPGVLWLLEQAFPHYRGLVADPLLTMIGYCFVVSIGQAMLFTRNASSGGIDILGKLFHKFLHIDIGRAMSAAGLCIAASAILFYPAETVVLAMLGTYLNGMLVDHFVFGMHARKKVCIISDQYEQICEYILKELGGSATLYDAEGAYGRKPYREIVTIVEKNNFIRLLGYVSKVDSGAFMSIYTVNELVSGAK